MNIVDLPNELLISIIYKLNCITVLRLYCVSTKFKDIIDEYISSIYTYFDEINGISYYTSFNSLIPITNTSNLYIKYNFRNLELKENYSKEQINFKFFSKIYSTLIKKKKETIIILKYIHKWLTMNY